MTPADLMERWEIHRRREDRKDDRAAWMVHHIMAALVGSEHAPSVDQLRGRVVKG